MVEEETEEGRGEVEGRGVPVVVEVMDVVVVNEADGEKGGGESWPLRGGGGGR